jgi:hypothetical protein
MRWVSLLAIVAFTGSSLIVAQAPPPLPPQGARPGAPVPGGQLPGLPPPRDTTGKPQTGTARLRGRVLTSPGNMPLRRAQISIFATEGQVRRVTQTDGDGRYEFVELPAGRFSVSALKAGYVTLQYGQRRPFEPGTPVVVADGQTVSSIDFSLPRGGVIEGRVTDEFGEPIAQAQVQAQRFQYGPDGQRRLSTMQTSTSDDRGQFRVYGLMPGDYVINAAVRSTALQIATPNPNDVTEGFAPTFYPGTLNSNEAQVVTLGIGEEKSVQFSLTAARLARVAGTVTTSDGRPATGAQVIILGRQGSISISTIGIVAPDGKFASNGVPPGEYSLEVRLQARGGGTSSEFASVPVDVGAADIDNLRIVTGRGAMVTGRVIFEGTSPRISGGPTPARVFPQPASPSPTITFAPDAIANGTLDDAGNFELGGVSGRVYFTVGIPNWVVKSVTLSGDDITDQPVDLTGRESVSDLVITMTDKLTDVSGVVTDARGQQLTDYVVVIQAADEKDPLIASRWTRITRPNNDGRFQIRGARPGRYVAAAVESLEQGRQFAPEFQQRLRQGAREFSVREGESVTVDLRLTPDL